MTTPWSPPFFTQVDPEIAVKGSVDPLGMQPFWTRYGREVVGNLTTVASSARGFTTALLAYHVARRALDENRITEEQFVDAFLTVEQLVGYSRLARAEDTGDPVGRILGIRRIRARHTDGKGRVTVGPGRDAQIMSNQKAYGLWGLFSVAAEDSGLLERKRLRLCDMGQAIVDQTMLPVLQRHGLKNGDALIKLVAKAAHVPQPFEPSGRHHHLGQALAELHAPTFTPQEQPLYRDSLVHAPTAHKDERQHLLWEVLQEHNQPSDDHPEGTWHHRFGLPELRACIEGAHRHTETHPSYATLADRLEHIRRFEQVAGPMARLFSAMLNWEDWPLDQAIEDVLTMWGDSGLTHIDDADLDPILTPVLELHGEDGVARFTRIRDALQRADYRTAITETIAQNADVMARRRGGPWVALTPDDRIKVRYRSEPQALPNREQLPDLWVHPYFLGALKQVGAEVMNLLPKDAPTHIEDMQEEDAA